MKDTSTSYDTVVGVDIAKDVFQVHLTDESTGELVKKAVSRKKFLDFFANRKNCLIGMEACGGSHYWARELKKLGHKVKLMPGKDVKAFNPGNKDDAADARAIWMAVQQSSVREVAVKTEEQQSILAMHKIREIKVKQRVAIINQIRGLLMEFGEVMPRGHKAIREGLGEALERIQDRVPTMLIQTIEMMFADARRLDEQVKEIENQLKAWAKTQEACQRLQEVPGVGLITATSFVATVGDAKVFKSGRQLAAFIGVAPRHIGSGGKTRVLGMSKRGDPYLRKMLIHGARAVVTLSKEPPKAVTRLLNKHATNVVVGAMANKMVRIMWSMMAHGTRYEKAHVCVL